jgi:hypothetical protein
MRYHLEEETTLERTIGSERKDHQRSRRSPAMKASRAWRRWGWERAIPSPELPFWVNVHQDQDLHLPAPWGSPTLMRWLNGMDPGTGYVHYMGYLSW